MRCRVFAVESGPGGARRFIASTYAEFWRRYEVAPPQCRHHYEIIRQGAACHLYFGGPPVLAAAKIDRDSLSRVG